MEPENTFLHRPIRSLQTMLRVISDTNDHYPKIIPDGIYGPETAAAVSEFQKNQNLPVTGITDQETWNSIVSCYENAEANVLPAHSLDIIMNTGTKYCRNSCSCNIRLAQAMLYAMSEKYTEIPCPGASGMMDTPTCDCISAFQLLCSLPATGELDKLTWKHLALHYSHFSGMDHSV